MSACELFNLGFKPSGETYWAFSLTDEKELVIDEFSVKELIERNTTKPFLINV